MADARDARHMARALQLARRGLFTTQPNPRVGCVLVRDDRVVGEGWHERAGEAHAEVNSLRAAGDAARGGTAYVSLEPCCHHGRTPPCTDALIEAGVRRVVAAMQDPNPAVAGQGAQRLREAGIEVEVGLLAAEAAKLNPGFNARMQRGRPYVRAKLAASLDGRTAMASGESKWITGEAARADVQRWRARSSAMLTGSGTVRIDDPALTVRGLTVAQQPLRVVVESRREPISVEARLFREDGETLVATAGIEPDRAHLLRAAGAEVLVLAGEEGRVDLSALLRELGRRGVNELMVEAGPRLNGALLAQGLVDEILLYLAPHLMGDASRGLFHLPGLQRLADRIELEIVDVRTIGRDWRVQARVLPTTALA
jgi:diaminohydroxyphosphoribosylaminopyrimidine deaminase/5-amino-6-(5-phosphoribosylamino)uracil reductase